MRRRLVVTCALTSALGFSACGGGDSGPSERDFLAALEDLCDDYDEDEDEIDDRVEADDDRDIDVDLEEVGAARVELVVELREDVAALEAPSRIADEVEQFLDLLDDIAIELDDVVDALVDDDFAEVGESIEELNERQREIAEVAQELDADKCEDALGEREPDSDTSGDAATTLDTSRTGWRR